MTGSGSFVSRSGLSKANVWKALTEESVSTDSLPVGFTAQMYDDDIRDPSRYFIVYKTGSVVFYQCSFCAS